PSRDVTSVLIHYPGLVHDAGIGVLPRLPQRPRPTLSPRRLDQSERRLAHAESGYEREPETLLDLPAERTRQRRGAVGQPDCMPALFRHHVALQEYGQHRADVVEDVHAVLRHIRPEA